MPLAKGSFEEHLSGHRQITISVTGRKSGRTISIPVWFVFRGETLYLLPVEGSGTQWYKNLLHNPQIQIATRGAKEQLRAVPITAAKAVNAVVENFRQKYGAGDVKKYYSKFDVAVEVELGRLLEKPTAPG